MIREAGWLSRKKSGEGVKPMWGCFCSWFIEWFMMFHAWLCEVVFGGVLPDWLIWLHELLGLV
jgi:hypothetical protein